MALFVTKKYCISKTHLFKYIKNFTTKNWKFSDKNSDIFHISAQNIDCGYLLELPCQGSSIEYPQSMFLNRNRKNNVYPCKPQFYYIKVGFEEVKIIYGKCPKNSNTKVSDKMTYANSVDPDQSDQGLHCLPFHSVF